ncbi:hypothetical protein GGR56DRAFT_323949 [Xylariaceae sp. FL0804]|nr:hypothetical protein GGR56DRAFT_323949 [Xylariaceae sp. FL0804]
MPKKQPASQHGPSAAATGDSRFASFESNPRFKLPAKNRGKTKLDKRFSRMLTDKDFTASAKVDKYGRKLKSDSKKKALQKLYEPEDDEDDSNDDDDEDGHVEVEQDDVVRRELEKADAKVDPARGGGFSSSEEDNESDAEDDEDEDDDERQDTEVAPSASMSRLRDEQAGVEVGDVTRRIAIVNLDWDHIKSTDLLAVFSSFVPDGGRIEKLSIYPSEFGKERMQREELEGPPKEIFKKSSKGEDNESELESDSSDSEDDEKIKEGLLNEGDDQDFDSDALRAYQLDRLRYYYAVMICSDPATAQKIYEATDGTEYQTSSNFIDLRFVPDDVTFDDEPRDECDAVSPNYQPTEFTTNALQHSKVKLTWDMHPEEAARRDDIKRAFTGSRAELQENDLRAYIASDSDGEAGSEEDEHEEADVAEEQPKLSKKELKAQRLREALGLGSAPVAKSTSKSGAVGDMQITFSAALMDGDAPKKNEPETEETTREKYIRKEKERKARRKEKSVAKRTDASEEAAAADEVVEDEADLGFDDPFFTTDAPTQPIKASSASRRKEDRLKKREAREAEAAEKAAQAAQLKELMAEDSRDAVEHLDHFNMDEIRKAEKKKSKKHKKKGKQEETDHGGLQDGFEMNVGDSRFQAVFENHEFAIDPSNPRYQATSGMKKLLDERRKKRKGDFEGPPDEQQLPSEKSKRQRVKGADDDISSLVESIRRKAKSKR